MNPLILLLLGGAGFYLWQSGALAGILPSRNMQTGLLMDPPRPPSPTAPTTGTSGFPGGTTGGIIAGVAAGVGALIYAIKEQGLFRGGEEGVKVNPARDNFMSQFPPAGTTLGDRLASALLNALMASGLPYEQAEQERQRLMDRPMGIFAADTMDKLRASVDQIAIAFARVNVHIDTNF